MRVEGKTASITGGAFGLGKADAAQRVGEGAQVLVTDINEQAGRAVADQPGCQLIHHAVVSEDDWRSVMKSTTHRYGTQIVVDIASSMVGG